jgi:hypothetical protein
VSRAAPLHELIARLDPFRDRVRAALALAGREAGDVEDELTRDAEAARRRLEQGREEGLSPGAAAGREDDWLDARRRLGAWQLAVGEFADQARRLGRFFEEHWPAMHAALRAAADGAAEEHAGPGPPPAGPPGRPAFVGEPPRGAPSFRALEDPAKEAAWQAALSAEQRPPEPAVVVEAGGKGPGVGPRLPLRTFGVEDVRQGWGRLRWAWDEAAAGWCGPDRQAFEGGWWQPLEAEVRALLGRVAELGEAAEGILRRAACGRCC